MEELFKYNLNSYSTLFFEDKTEIEKFASYRNKVKTKNLEFRKKNVSEKEEDFVENFGNPLTSIVKKYLMIVVERKENKISLKIFDGKIMRGVGKKFFRRRKNLNYITINKNTGDVYYGRLLNFNMKNKKRNSLTKNFFFNNIIHGLVHTVKSVTSNNQEAIENLLNAFEIFSNEIPHAKKNFDKSLSEQLLEFYLIKKGIKYPNNFKLFWEKYEYKMPLPFIRKHQNKLVDAFMKNTGLKGDSIKKVLHEIEHMNLPILKLCLNFFPEDWVRQDEKFIKDCLHFGNNGGLPTSFYFGTYDIKIDELNLTLGEKRKMFELFKNVVLKNKIQLYTFFDHANYYKDLKNLGEDIKWNSKNKEEFDDEHLKFSDKLDYYKKGHYSRIYPEYFYESLQKEINIDGDLYYPVLLNDSTNYNRESSIQSNCVKNYIGNSSSTIISLRKGNVDSEERATIEFRLQLKQNKQVEYTVPQALGRFNNTLDNSWNKPLDILKDMFYKCIKDPRFETVKLKKVFINGKELSSDSSWDDDGRLRWNMVDITKYY